MDRRLQEVYRRLRRRTRQQAAFEGAAWGVLAWLTLALFLSGAARLWPLVERTTLLLGLACALPFLLAGGALLAAFWPRPIRRWLLTCDARLGLAERLTTAWEIAHQHLTVTPAMREAQREDTLTAFARADLKAAFPLRLPRPWRIAAAALLLLLLPLWWLPNPQDEELARRAALRQAAAAQAERLEAARATLAQSDALTPEQRAEALKALDEAIRTLQDARSTPESQQAALQKAEQRLAELQADARPTAAQALAQAAPLSAPDVAQPLVEALQRGDLEAAQAYVSALTDPSYPTMTPEEQQALGATLETIGEALESSAPDLAEAFKEAGSALQNGDAHSAEAIEQLRARLEALAQAQAAAQNLEQAQAQLQSTRYDLAQTQKAMQQMSGSSSQQSGNTPGQSGRTGTQDGNTSGQGTTGAGAEATGNQGAEGSTANPMSGHSEDSGTGAPYGTTTWERLHPQSGSITLPREKLQGSGTIGPGTTGSATVNYREVYVSYTRAAETSLARQAYPPVLRAYVRDYFASLEP